MNAIIGLARRAKKNPSQFLIAVTGFTLAWLCVVGLGIHLYHEFTYDQFHQNAERIFRITHNEKAGEIPGTRHLATVGPPMGPALKEQFPGVEEYVRFRTSADWLVRVNNTQHYEQRVSYVDPSVFKVFSFPFLDGDPESALSLPENVVLTARTAKKYFNETQVVGRMLEMNGKQYRITGVLADIPSNSHIRFDFLLPFQSFTVPFGYPVTLESWGWISFHTYVLLKRGHTAAELERQLPQLVNQHWTPERAKKFKIQLQPLTNIYFGDVHHEDIVAGNGTYAMVLALAALAIFVVAAFNYTNIFFVSGLRRTREAAVKKILGARRSIMYLSFQVESTILIVFSLAIALASFPFLQQFFPWQTDATTLTSSEAVVLAFVLLLIAFVTGWLSAVFPAKALGSATLQQLLKGSFKSVGAGSWMRKAGVLTQIAVSTGLLCCVAVVSSQMDFLEHKDLGYRKSELLAVHVPGEHLNTSFESFKTTLLSNPFIANVSVSGGRLDGDNGNVPIFTETTGDTGLPMAIDAVGFEYFRTIGVPLLVGREFTRDKAADTLQGVIVNISAVKEFGWTPQEAIGKKIRVSDIVINGEIIGVVPDYNFGSLHHAVMPLVLSYPRTRLEDVFIRFDPRHLQEIVPAITRAWTTVFPALPLDYSFLDEHLMSLYKSEQTFSSIIQFFAIVAVIIACLGAFAVVSQDVLYRTKEIGVRKVLGASDFSLISMLLRSMVIITILANLIAWPVADVLMNTWLNEFSYHIAVDWYIYPVAGACVLLVSILSVMLLAVRASKMKCVESLKTE
ncbi:MAG TPA: ABC transporter permease [Chryseosolibacter sp.]|nr:ABC transporter permease [Chryseosolibacter sp.]